jgi:predicted XRE-type DNA-binding protein
MKKDRAATRSGGNIFADLGLPNADEHLLKARFVMMIGLTIKQRGFTQEEAANLMGIAQPDVSKLLRGRFEGFSLERILGFVRALGSDVEIKVKAANENREGRMSLKMEAAGV